MSRTTNVLTRALAMVLTLAMVLGMLPMSVFAVETSAGESGQSFSTMNASDAPEQLTDEEKLRLFAENMDTDKVSEADIPDADEEVRVIVELEVESLLSLRESENMETVAMGEFLESSAAKAQLLEIQSVQNNVLAQMQAEGITGQVTYSYTAVTGGFGATMTYGDIAKVAEMDGVARVSLCDVYYPDVVGTAALGEALTAAEVAAYANNTEYQGEGMLIGIVDTGLDHTHEAFANAPAVQKLTKDSLNSIAKYDFTYDENGDLVSVSAYSYAALWYAQANSTSSELALLTADDLYKSAKVPFG